MTDPKTPNVSRSFKDVCVVENAPNGKGIQVTAFGKDGQTLATGKDFVKQGLWDDFIDNMNDLVSVGGKVVGDSYTVGNGKYGATYKDGGIKLDVAAGSCEVTTVDAGQISNKPVQLGVALKDVPFTAGPGR